MPRRDRNRSVHRTDRRTEFAGQIVGDLVEVLVRSQRRLAEPNVDLEAGRCVSERIAPLLGLPAVLGERESQFLYAFIGDQLGDLGREQIEMVFCFRKQRIRGYQRG